MNRAYPTTRRSLSRRLTAGILGLGVIAALIAGTPASAAGPSPIPRLSHALKGLTSYRVDVRVSSGKVSSSTLRIDVVRAGKSTSAHLTGTVTAASGTQTIDAVIVGSKVCVKIGNAAYRCISNPQIAAQLNQDPSLSLTQASKTTTYRTVAPVNFNHVSCDGYASKSTQGRVAVSSTLYIQHTTGRPCKVDVITSGKVSGVSANAETVATWSLYNESLTIPRLK